MDYEYTRYQVARGSRPDATTAGNDFFLFKNTSSLRATYQIRLLTFMAQQKGIKLIISLPKGTKIHPTIDHLRKNTGKTIKIERH